MNHHVSTEVHYMSDPRHPFEIIHGLVNYPFPLAEGMAQLLLPLHLTADDAERLAAFVMTLAQDEA